MKNIYKNILVAIDNSKEAEFAFKKAIDIAKKNDANLLLTHVIDPRMYGQVEAYDRNIAGRADQIASDLSECKKIAVDAGVKHVEYIVEFGTPQVTIPKEIAVKNNCDLIVCGQSELNPFEKLFIGSVSKKITRYAPCEVMVVGA